MQVQGELFRCKHTGQRSRKSFASWNSQYSLSNEIHTIQMPCFLQRVVHTCCLCTVQFHHTSPSNSAFSPTTSWKRHSPRSPTTFLLLNPKCVLSLTYLTALQNSTQRHNDSQKSPLPLASDKHSPLSSCLPLHPPGAPTSAIFSSCSVHPLCDFIHSEVLMITSILMTLRLHLQHQDLNHQQLTVYLEGGITHSPDTHKSISIQQQSKPEF